MRRGRLEQALVVVAGVLLLVTAVAAYAWRAVLDSDRFADRATSVLRDPNVREAIADRVTDDLVLGAEPDLLAARPLIVDAVSSTVGGAAFTSLFRRSVRDVHRAVFGRDQDTVTLTLADVGIVAAAAVQVLDPELASRLDAHREAEVLSSDIGSVTGDVARKAETLRWVTVLLAVLTLAAAGAALALGADRRRTVTRLGAAAMVAGVVIVAGEIVARAVVLDGVSEPDLRAAAGAVWDAFLGDLTSTGWLIAACGAVVCAAATSRIRAVALEEPLRAGRRLATTEPRSTGLRVVRGVLLIAAGVLIVTEPAAALRIVATVAGVYVAYKGVEALLRLIPPAPERPAAAGPPRRRPSLRRLAVPAAATVLIALGVSAFVAGGGADEPAAAAVTRCNGHAELCDRPLDEVVLPATHNSMSVPLPGWFSALQERPIAGQLEDGIRGLLLDTHYADLLANGRTRTHFGSQEDLRNTIESDGVSRESVEAALRLRERLGFRGPGKRGMYLCHTFCELGSTPLASVLEDVNEFLVSHPGEVVVVINQDAVAPADFVRAVQEAGLAPRVYEPPPPGADWPTLGELIERDQRLVLLAENEAGAAPWYQLAYEHLTQETPYTFGKPALLTTPAALEASCAPNRGPDDAPLLLLNHWVNTDPAPRPSQASIVNAHDALLARARECERRRGQRVNLVAVDFYRRGDLFEVVDELNGL